MANDKAKRIQIWTELGDREEYTNSKEEEYFTAVGVAGELILYRVTLHQILSAKGEPTIWKVWSQYCWTRMEHDEV